jgi:hypothetical protein
LWKNRNRTPEGLPPGATHGKPFIEQDTKLSPQVKFIHLHHLPYWETRKHSTSGLMMAMSMVLMLPILFDLIPHTHTEDKHCRNNKAKNEKDHSI